MTSKFIDKQLQELDTPLTASSSVLKKKKIRLIIINEDLSFSEKFLNYPSSYVFDVLDKSYILVPKCVIRGKYPTLIYYYNNPFPLFFVYERSKLTALDLRNNEQILSMNDHQKTILANIFLDAEALNLAFNTRVMKGLYANKGLTAKHIIIILVVVTVIILVFLQVFGVVDVMGMISGSAKK